jgi:transcriptional regulator with XRE-family HTH domain
MEPASYTHKSPIGPKIRKARILRDMSQDDLASKMNISKSAMSRLENAFEIEEDILKQVCEILMRKMFYTIPLIILKVVQLADKARIQVLMPHFIIII